MTPLVDVAFLLLTFFMFATTMSQPTMMDIRVPVDDTSIIKVAESKIWTIFVSDDNELFYNTGRNQMPVPLQAAELRATALDRNRNQPERNALITVLKVDPSAQYAKVVEVIDQLNLVENDLVREYRSQGLKRDRKFTILPMEESYKEQLARL